ncbi:hypothetical protein X772_32260 [Mesorhizobium sp. LSJC280B00]|nr:hypothetical protein X772_32260 [Mesorhizobium sp. LSJC280B00]
MMPVARKSVEGMAKKLCRSTQGSSQARNVGVKTLGKKSTHPD